MSREFSRELLHGHFTSYPLRGLICDERRRQCSHGSGKFFERVDALGFCWCCEQAPLHYPPFPLFLLKGSTMFGREDFLHAIAEETRICKHLHSKLQADKVDYKPCEGTRNTLELMQYLTCCGSVPAEALIENDWSKAGGHLETAKSMTFADFPAHMDRQQQAIENMLADLSDADLHREVGLPWGEDTKLGPGLVNTSLRFLASYRLQLFNHAKAAGAADIGTLNAWRGMDAPK